MYQPVYNPDDDDAIMEDASKKKRQPKGDSEPKEGAEKQKIVPRQSAVSAQVHQEKSLSYIALL